MREEFHGIWEPRQYKLLYGWGTLSASVWLPSLSELVGIDPNKYNATIGCYCSAMQGLNTSSGSGVDAQGGSQWNYFQQYNQSGGGETIMNACKQQVSWLRSTYCSHTEQIWYLAKQTAFNTSPATTSLAVHPAVG